MRYYPSFPTHGDIAQLVERLNGIEKVRGSTPLISTKSSDEKRELAESQLLFCFMRISRATPFSLREGWLVDSNS